MIKIKFINRVGYHNCEFSRVSDHVVTLGKCTEQNTSAFTARPHRSTDHVDGTNDRYFIGGISHV